MLLVARVLHVVLGVFRVGTMSFNASFLGPSLRDAGPNAGPVMANLIGRRMLDVIPLAATLNLLSGLYLYWTASTGWSSAYMGSRAGITYGVGAVAALVAFTMGITLVRPSRLRAAALGTALDVPSYVLFGGKVRGTLPVYANIDRATKPRTPAGFAAVAARREAIGPDVT